MANSTPATRLIVELAPHSLQFVFVDAGGRMVAYKECALNAAAVSAVLAEAGLASPPAGFLALVVPSAGFVLRANADEAASIRTVKSLLARAETIPHGLGSSLNVVAFDSVNGQRIDTVGKAPWVLAGVADEQVAAAKEKLVELGLGGAEVRLALPVGVGAVVTALQDMPESSRVLVWQLGISDAQLACVSAGGCEAAGTAAVGYDQIFEAVQSGLGLKFRAAASKLFFNAGYDFSETAGPIAERLAALLRPAIAQLDCTPTVLHVAGLPAGQLWLAKAVAAALDLGLFAPKVVEFCTQCGLKGEGVSAELPGTSLGLLFQAAATTDDAAWRASWLDANAPAAVAVAAPTPVVKPVAPVAAPDAAKPAVVVPVKPKPVPVAAGAAPAAALKPAAKAAPAPVAPAPAPVAKAGPKPMTAMPVVAKPAKQPMPVPVAAVQPQEEQIEEAVASTVPAKKPIALWATVAAIVALGGVAVYFVTRGGGGEEKVVTAPAVAVLSAEEVRLREMEQARWLADEMKTPRSFRNDRYSFEVADRGFLRKLVGAGNRTLIDEFGWLELQGTISGTSTPFTAGTMGDQAYVATINKTVRDGKVVFEIKGVHPRFTMDTLVTCLPNKLQIETTFKPLNMREPRGMLSGTYMVKMNRQSLSLGQRAVAESGKVSYSTQSGPVILGFNNDTWGPVGEAGKQAVMVASNLVFFDFAGNGASTGTTLKAELTLP